jgi:hypothetical protein
MRILGLATAVAVTLSPSAAPQTCVGGNIRSEVTYVEGHCRSSPDHSPYNNYSYPGSTNRYTGETATREPSPYLQRSYSYPSSRGSYRVGSSSHDE